MFRTIYQAAVRRPITVVIAAGLALSASAAARSAAAQFSGDFVESFDHTDVRSKVNPSQINSFVPSGRGPFTFPPPYSAQGVRITTHSDCGGEDCVNYVGYSYWRNINDHADSDTMLIFLGLNRGRGGAGPTLFSYTKSTGKVANRGRLFDPGRNGAVFSTSTVAPSYPLRLAATLFDVNTSVNNTVIAAGSAVAAKPSGSTQAPVSGADHSVSAPTMPAQSAEVPKIQNVVWTNVLNVAPSGSSLMKTGGCNGCPDAGGISKQQISSGDGYVEFTIPETFSLRLVGLSTGNPGTDSSAIAFAIRTQQGIAEVREHSVYRSDIPLAAGDVFRIAVTGGVVTYAKNGAIFYTSSAAPLYPLLLAATLYDVNTSVNNAVIAGNFANALTS